MGVEGGAGEEPGEEVYSDRAPDAQDGSLPRALCLLQHSVSIQPTSAHCILFTRVDLKEKDWINSHHRESAVTKFVSNPFMQLSITYNFLHMQIQLSKIAS